MKVQGNVYTGTSAGYDLEIEERQTLSGKMLRLSVDRFGSMVELVQTNKGVLELRFSRMNPDTGLYSEFESVPIANYGWRAE